MQAVVLLCLLGVVAALAAPQKYPSKYDAIDVDAVLKNERVVTQYVNCLTGAGSCTPEGREFKEHLPDALATSCAKCTDAQKNIIRKASKHLITKRPADWRAIVQKFDPTESKKESFAAFLAGTN